MTRSDLVRLSIVVVDEAELSASRWGPFRSLHEAMAVTREEFDELWELCRLNQSKRDADDIAAEAIQLAACALKIAALAQQKGWIRK